MVQRNQPRVVIAGGGFGGLSAARTLARSPVEVVLVDRNNYHTFPPLLYQVAAGELEPGDIAYPVRTILRKIPNARFTLAEVTRVDLEHRLLETDAPDIPYDFLILATGTVDHFFVPGAREHAFSLKTLENAITLRNHILGCVEHADLEVDQAVCHQLLSFAIVGGGPTGVETAGALAELIQGPIRKDFPRLDLGQAQITLIEAAHRLLPTLPERLGVYAARRLRDMGVDVRLECPVQSITPDTVHLQEPTLQVPGHPEVYVVGDLAYFEEDGQPLPMVAQVALQGAECAARNIQRQMTGKEPLPFHYHDRGTMATIGRNKAAALAYGRTFTGFPAWLLWLGIHLWYLIGYRNRLLVLINWARHYLFREHAACRILPSEPSPPG
jgi:NADH dehydrogenase